MKQYITETYLVLKMLQNCPLTLRSLQRDEKMRGAQQWV